MDTIHLDGNDPTAKKVAQCVGYNGRTFQLKGAEKVSLSGTAWDGGSRSSYFCVRLTDGTNVALPHFDPPQFGGPVETPVVEIPPECAIVQHTIFCGKDMGLRLYVRPENITPMLPSKPELTREERNVLVATKSYKSSYNGKNRRELHNEGYSYGREDWLMKLTQEAWDTAKASLISKGFLDKRGAITPAGRNAL